MAAEVMITDMIEIDCFGDPRHLVDIAQKTVQIQVIADAVLITLEVGHIHRIKRTSVVHRRISASVSWLPVR